MTVEEKTAVQTVILNEIAQQRESNPTLLLDVLLSGQGYQFIHMVIAKQHGQAQNLAAMTDRLLKSLEAAASAEAEA